jgi:aerobic C4-dicarboxylate transport protein
VATYSKTAMERQSFSDFILHVIPENVVGAFANGDLLQILCFSVLFGIAVSSLGKHGEPIVRGMEHLTEVMFGVVSLVMKVAPIGALGAMAFTVGKYGIGLLGSLAKLMACVYLTMALFIFGVLWIICRAFGFSLFSYLRYIREEILLVLGTSSSESALPRMIEKLELIGCSRDVVRMVIPAGYSFNLDGTSIYLSMAVLFIAQAFNVHLSFGQQIYIMAVLMLTSKGAAAVTGGGFITLAATLTATKVLPVEGLALLLGVDRFMSEARAITNLIGNGVATIVVSKMEGEFDDGRYQAAIRGETIAPPARGFSVEVAADVGSES